LYDFLSDWFALALGLELISCSFFGLFHSIVLGVFLLWVLSGYLGLWFFNNSVSYWLGVLSASRGSL
jgi:hypothetical protein